MKLNIELLRGMGDRVVRFKYQDFLNKMESPDTLKESLPDDTHEVLIIALTKEDAERIKDTMKSYLPQRLKREIVAQVLGLNYTDK